MGPDLGPNCLQKLSADDIDGKDLIDINSGNQDNSSTEQLDDNSATLLSMIIIIGDQVQLGIII